MGNYRGEALALLPEGRQASHVALAVLGLASQGDPCSSLRAVGARGQWLVGESSISQHPKPKSFVYLGANLGALPEYIVWVPQA